MPEPASLPIDAPRPAPNSPRWAVAAALVLLALAGFSAAMNYVWNADIFWHLASGEWMLNQKSVLGANPFTSEPAPDETRWVNVHWLFQVIVAAVHAVSGFAGLTVLKALLAAGVLLVLARSLRRHAPAGWILLAGLGALLVMTTRLRVRPEIFTLLFMAVAIALLEHVRDGGKASRLWWLAPLMLVWANMHGLFIFGLGLIWSAVLGAWMDRLLGRAGKGGALPTQAALVPCVAATVLCLLTPWPVEGFLHPLLLVTRISGEAYYYTFGVSELRPTYDRLGELPDAIVLTALTTVLMLVHARRVPAAHWLWLAAFVAVALTALRNVGFLGPVCGYLLGRTGGELLAGVKGPVRKAGLALTPLCMLAAGVLIFGFVTEQYWALRGSERRFGAGLDRAGYPISCAEYLRDLPAEGDVLCVNFGDGGVMIHHAWPRRKVWMDGRLEVHSQERFIRNHEINRALADAVEAARVKLPDSVRFLVASRAWDKQLAALSQSPRFRLVHVGPVGAVFARMDWAGGRAGLAGAGIPESPDLAKLDRPIDENGAVEGAPAVRAKWYAANPHSAALQQGKLLLDLSRKGEPSSPQAKALGQKLALLAIRYLEAAHKERPEDPIIAGLLADAHLEHAAYRDVTLSWDIPVDIDLSRALYLYNRHAPEDLSDDEMQTLALRRVKAMVQANQLDAAATAVEAIFAKLPPRLRVNPPELFTDLRNAVNSRLAVSRGLAEQMDLEAMSVEERVAALVSPRLGLIDAAVAELESHETGENPRLAMLTGHLLMRKGLPWKAMDRYKSGVVDADDFCPDARMLPTAVLGLASGDAPAPRRPTPAEAYYTASVLEQLGLYERARGVLSGVESDNQQLQTLILRLRLRLR